MGHADMAVFLRSAVFWLGLTASAAAEDIKIIVNSVSDGHAIHARVFAQHLQKYSGHPVTIKSAPGAAGITTTNYIYSVAAKIGVIVSPVSWREAEKIVQDMSNTPLNTVSRLKQF